MLVPVHIATLVLVAVLLVTLAAGQLVERPAGQWFSIVSPGGRELVPVPTGRGIQCDLSEQWPLCYARRGSPAAHLRAPVERSSCVRC